MNDNQELDVIINKFIDNEIRKGQQELDLSRVDSFVEHVTKRIDSAKEYLANIYKNREKHCKLVSECNINIISLGLDCLPRTILSKYGLKKTKLEGEVSCPFDLSIHPISAVSKLIDCNFDGYLSPENLSLKNGHPVHNDLGVMFNHERECFFSENNFEQLISRYQARINNFNEAIDNRPTLFVIHCKVKKGLVELIEAIRKRLNTTENHFVIINTGNDVLDNSTLDVLNDNKMMIHCINISKPFEQYNWYNIPHYTSNDGIAFENSIVSGVEKILHDIKTKKIFELEHLAQKKRLESCHDGDNKEKNKMLWLSLGENCITDDILRRHGKKSFSTPYSPCRSNIDYALMLEHSHYQCFLDKNNLMTADAWGKPVIRSTLVTICDNVYETSHTQGFEFTHHDPLNIDSDRDSFRRKIDRLIEARGSQDIIFWYHHRKNKNSNIPLLREKLNKFSEYYKGMNNSIFIVLFYQSTIEPQSERKLEFTCFDDNLLEFNFYTENIWGGNQPDIFWGKIDDDLIGQMIEKVSFLSNKKHNYPACLSLNNINIENNLPPQKNCIEKTNMTMKATVEFQRTPKPRLLVHYSDEHFNKEIYFKIPNDFFISNDSLVALIIACRPKAINEIAFDFQISERARKIIESHYKIKVVDNAFNNEFNYFGFDIEGATKERTENYLNFSGGVDSLAAHYLTKKDAHLISIDFGEIFSRESDFFSEWNTYTVKTNFRDKPFSEAMDWRFMAAGAILMSDYLKINTIFFGTILEAAPWWFKFEDRNSFENTITYHAFSLANLQISQPVASLSEYGTTVLALKFGEDILHKSIKSSSTVGSSKLFRKLLLQKLVMNEEISNEWVDINKPKKLNETGKSYSEDILALYFSSKLGIEFVNSNIIKTNVDFVNFSNSVDMGFFEKYNQKNLSVIPENLRGKFEQKILQCGIDYYNQDDVHNFNLVKNYLDKKYGVK